MPFRPPRVPLGQMNAREQATFFSQAGVQADGEVKTLTPVWTGFSANPVGNLSYYDFGAVVVIWNNTAGQIVGTSNATTMTITNLPESITPDNDVIGPSFVIDNSGAYAGQVSITSAGVMGFTLLSVSGSLVLAGVGGLFTASGNKGLPTGWLIMYPK